MGAITTKWMGLGVTLNKKIWVLLVILILSVSLVNAIKILTVNETDLVSLKPRARDEDADELFYSFTEPLDENGRWQTNYGDAGDYKVTVTVSDGKSSTSEDILLVVKKKNMAPTIDSSIPDKLKLTLDEGGWIDFSVEASDLNKDVLRYTWQLDGEIVSEGEDYRYNTDYWDEGVHKVKVIVSDAEEEEEKEWTVTVNNVDRESLLDNIVGVTLSEGEVVKLTLPDFEEYNLDYAISDPLGDDNRWETTYSDEGLYDVEVTIKDRKFSASKTIEVRVEDVDRAPVLKPLATVWMKETQKVSIELEAYDPDGDKIEFSAESLPDGASLEEDKFEWVTSYDTVKKENTVDMALDKFHLLYKPFRITFVARSKGSEARRSVLIIVKDVNRAPVLNDIPTITVNEGEEVIIKAEANELDGDSVIYTYSGWINTDTYKTDFDDAGAYRVKVTASDGFLSDEKYVTIVVKDVNRAPEFYDIPSVEVSEGEEVVISLEASDVDGDSVTITADPLPGNSTIEDNVFKWTLDFDTVTEGLGVVGINFKASDGKAETVRQANVTVHNVNRMPKIVSLTPRTDIIAQRNRKIKFEVVAEDADGDSLTYTWKFSLLEKYESKEAGIIRTFKSPGNKKVVVVVSDGEDEIEHVWKVKVV